MKFIVLIFLIIVLFVFSNCSSSKETVNTKDISLSTLYHKTEKENLYYKLPSEWTEVQDNNDQIFELWLVSPNNKSSITFIPINIDKKFIDTENSELLRVLMRTEDKIKDTTLKNFSTIGEIKEFENNKIKYISTHYLDDGNTKRSVIFGKDNLFYECIAYFESSYEPEANELANLFDIQQRVLLSLQMK